MLVLSPCRWIFPSNLVVTEMIQNMIFYDNLKAGRE